MDWLEEGDGVFCKSDFEGAAGGKYNSMLRLCLLIIVLTE
jgi:hypothetical protein